VNDDELLQLLRAANPVPDAQTLGLRAQPEADELLRGVMRAHRPRPRRALLIAAVIAIALLLLAGLAAFFLRDDEKPKSAPGSVTCATAPDLHARQVVTAGPGDPIALCRELWNKRVLGPEEPKDLAACVRREGALVVFPGEWGTTCRRLGLATPARQSDALVQFTTTFGRELERRCVGTREAIHLATRLLAEHGIKGWAVTVATDHPFGPQFPCAAYAMDEPTRTITIIPIFDVHG
jgi:hypothetical protein